jgi:hypothetical protein
MNIEKKDLLLEIFNETDIAMIQAVLEDRIEKLEDMKDRIDCIEREVSRDCRVKLPLDEEKYDVFVEAINEKINLAYKICNKMFNF